MADEKKKKGLMDKVVDALTDRDEKEAAAEAARKKAEAEAAAKKAQAEAAARQKAAEAKAAADKARAEFEAKQAMAKKQAETEKAAAEAKERARAAEAELARVKARERAEEVREAAAERAAKIQAEAEAREAAQKAAEEAERNKVRHTVVAGETLSHISLKYYKTANRWKEIYEANKDQIRDPDQIYPGQIFTVPDANPPETIDPERKEPLTSAEGGAVRADVAARLRDLARRPGWFPTVSELLDWLAAQHGVRALPAREWRLMQWRWARDLVARQVRQRLSARRRARAG